MVTVCYEDGAYRVGGLPDNQMLAFDTLSDLADAARALLDAVDTCYYSLDFFNTWYTIPPYMVGENC